MPIEANLAAEVLIADAQRSPELDPTAFGAHLEGDAVLACSGELDPSTNPALRRSLRRLVRLAPDRVVIDLSRVSFFDAGAIGEFARARTSSRAAGGDLVVRAPSVFGRRLLGIVGMSSLIDQEPGCTTAREDAPATDGARGVELAGQLAAAAQSGIVIDEAKGLIAEHFDVGIDEAAVMLRAFAIAQEQPVLAIAGALMDRTISVVRLAPLRPGHRAAVEGAAARGAAGSAPSRGS